MNAARRLQFSEAGTSANPTPSAADTVRGNRSAQMGKSLTFVPPIDRDGKLTAKLDEANLKPQQPDGDAPAVCEHQMTEPVQMPPNADTSTDQHVISTHNCPEVEANIQVGDVVCSMVVNGNGKGKAVADHGITDLSGH
ncbi:hypothetical protein K7X08_035069 [Anisodus acutangulus]|uniref:Uncharacterized protein n=1 Tax=Anisodus acutangulus TaxID=402998 RepID=A0A9Q1LGP1_9SOLA|nr:hypothetical protein K7X08_035069 [Anisodus acutangulus]